MDKGFAIAIDGPVAAGKGTIAPRLAKKLDGFYLYTGAMYRCLALFALKKGVDVSDNNSIISLLPEVNIEFKNDSVILNGKDVTEKIKEEEIASGSSKVAVIPQVREHMVKTQQEIAKKFIEEGKIVVAEGRDTGTKVFPNAKLKIFLTAKQEIRTDRRLAQLREQGNIKITYREELGEVKKRDKRDSERQTDPLISEPEKFDYFVLDNSNLSEDETLDILIKKVRELE